MFLLNCHISTNRFQRIPNKNIKGFLKLSYLVYSQIWLNLLVDGHQIDYITKLKENPYLHSLLLAIFFHFFDLENMISIHTKFFSEKHSPNWPGFEGKIKSKWSHFCNRFQQITKIFLELFFFKLSYMVYSQIWLNLLVDNSKITLHMFFDWTPCIILLHNYECYYLSLLI
jgi:hypothetical protein